MQCSTMSRFLVFLLRKRTGETFKTRFASLQEKERFLESKEKGAPVRVEWLQIGSRRPVFTPPLSTSTVHRRLRRWNRENLWFYPTFFRRLHRWVSGRGGAARYSFYGVARLPRRAHGTASLVGRDDSARHWHYDSEMCVGAACGRPPGLAPHCGRPQAAPTKGDAKSVRHADPALSQDPSLPAGGTGPFPFAGPWTFPCKCRGDLV